MFRTVGKGSRGLYQLGKSSLKDRGKGVVAVAELGMVQDVVEEVQYV